MRLLVSSEQRFTCAQCGRCCHRTTVPITIEEAAALRQAGAVRWFDEGDGTASREPFEDIPGHAPLLRIRKRADGACGFLSPQGLCRIHEELGADRKPIACRVFPFDFRPTDEEIIVSTSSACPTIVSNGGELLTAAKKDIQKVQLAWARTFPETPHAIELARGRKASREVVARLRSFLQLILDRPDADRPDGRPDLRANLRRIAALLDDWSRPRVLGLPDEALVEYLDLTGNYALSSDKSPPDRPATRVARLNFRGFLYAVMSLQARLDSNSGGLALRVTMARLLAHVHGIGPGVAGYDLRRSRRIPLRLDDAAVHAVVHRHLRACFETLGASRRPILDEVAVRVATLNAACTVGAMAAAKAGKPSVDADSLTQGLLAAGDLSHAEAGGPLRALLTMLAGGTEALYLFPPLGQTSAGA